MAIRQGATFAWTKSTHSAGNGACIEVKSPVVSALSVRDSKVVEGPVLTFPSNSWDAFVAGVVQGTFDLG